jgi:two-component system response regulator
LRFREPNKTVLLVEDEPAIAHLISYVIEECGGEVVVARDGLDALRRLLGDGGLRPRLVLMDLHMPQMDGFEALSLLKKDSRTRMLPVVMISSSDDPQDLEESYALGANGYVHKSSVSLSLPEQVKRTARYWLEVNEPPAV